MDGRVLFGLPPWATPTSVVELVVEGLAGVVVEGTATVGVVAVGGTVVAGAVVAGATLPGWAPPAGVVVAGVVAAGVVVGGVACVVLVGVVPWTRADAGIEIPKSFLAVVVLVVAPAPGAEALKRTRSARVNSARVNATRTRGRAWGRPFRTIIAS